jgi:hypothetical protein
LQKRDPPHLSSLFLFLFLFLFPFPSPLRLPSPSLHLEAPGAKFFVGDRVRGAGDAFGFDAWVDAVCEVGVFDDARGFAGIVFHVFSSARSLDAAFGHFEQEGPVVVPGGLMGVDAGIDAKLECFFEGRESPEGAQFKKITDLMGLQVSEM